MNATDQFAFPVDSEATIDQAGMTLLDYFAARALPIFAENHFRPDARHHECTKINSGGGKEVISVTYAQDASERAYLLAAAMLEERKKYM